MGCILEGNNVMEESLEDLEEGEVEMSKKCMRQALFQGLQKETPSVYFHDNYCQVQNKIL